MSIHIGHPSFFALYKPSCILFFHPWIKDVTSVNLINAFATEINEKLQDKLTKTNNIAIQPRTAILIHRRQKERAKKTEARSGR